MSESYTDFARVYDIFMDETPYEEWTKFLVGLILRLGISKPGVKTEDALESERNLVLDLGCGTGNLTERMEQQGFDMIGVDNSEDMLRIALEKKEKAGSKTLYLLQDMRELELFSTVGTVISVCDSIIICFRRRICSPPSNWSIIIFIPADFSFLISIRCINTKQ